MTEDLSKSIRKYIYKHFYDLGYPPTVELLSHVFNKDREEIISELYSLHDDHLIVIDKKINKVMIANPFAGIQTSFQVIARDDKRYSATCAWDSIAMHITLEEAINIEAYCYYCNDPIMLSLANDKIVSKIPNDVLIHFQYPARKWWDDIIDTCYNTMNFFCSQDHLQEWTQLNPDRSGYHLSDEQIMDISILLYRNKMSLDYQRPTTDELRSRFAKSQLTGDFWKI
jgi:hypothetical protein